METLRLVINIISTSCMSAFGIIMILVGVLNIKYQIESKWFSIVMIPNGITLLALVIMSWFW